MTTKAPTKTSPKVGCFFFEEVASTVARLNPVTTKEEVLGWLDEQAGSLVTRRKVGAVSRFGACLHMFRERGFITMLATVEPSLIASRLDEIEGKRG